MSKDPIANQKFILRNIEARFNELAQEFGQKTRFFPKFSKRVTTVGGSAVEEITISGVQPYMKCMVNMRVQGATPVDIKSAKCSADKLSINFSGDPGNDHEIEYFIFK